MNLQTALDQHISDLSDGGITFTVADTISLLTRAKLALTTLESERDDAKWRASEAVERCKDYRQVANDNAAARELAESRLSALTQELDALKARNEAAASRLEAELNTPGDIWADHIREALRLLTEAEATRDNPMEPR